MKILRSIFLGLGLLILVFIIIFASIGFVFTIISCNTIGLIIICIVIFIAAAYAIIS